MLTRRRLLVALLLLGCLALGAALVWQRTGEPLPSPVAGQEVPEPRVEPLARIAVAGDTGTGGEDAFATGEAIADRAAATSAYDALVLLGDLVYEDGEADLVDARVREPFAGVLAGGAELVPVLGNHDYRSGEQGEILCSLGRDASWYVDTVGPVRVVVLDTERVDDREQGRWLAETLAAPVPEGTWTVVALHRPPYSAGEHGPDRSVREAWVPLFEEYDVPLVLAGHEHDYQRTDEVDGVTYVVSGAGAKLRSTGHDELTAVSASTLHFVELLAYRNRLVGHAIDHEGRLVDSFTLRR